MPNVSPEKKPRRRRRSDWDGASKGSGNHEAGGGEAGVGAWRLATSRYAHGYTNEQVVQLINFIDWLMVLDDEAAHSCRAGCYSGRLSQPAAILKMDPHHAVRVSSGEAYTPG